MAWALNPRSDLEKQKWKWCWENNFKQKEESRQWDGVSKSRQYRTQRWVNGVLMIWKWLEPKFGRS